MAIRLSENFRALFYAPFYAAHATGAFTEAGVDVVLVPSPSPPAAVKALLAGEVDVMWGGPLRVMMLRDSDPQSDLGQGQPRRELPRAHRAPPHRVPPRESTTTSPTNRGGIG